MSSLANIQRDLQAFLLRDDATIESHVVGTDRVPIATRLGIYKHAYRSRLIDALRANHPVLAELLGEERFARLGADYVAAHDSCFFSIRHYGDALASFLGTGFLADLARWEWTVAEVFDAADAEPVTVATLTGITPDEWSELKFVFHPTMRCLTLTSNAPQVWRAAQTPQCEVEPTPWLLWRQNLRTLYRSLSTAEAQMLDGALRGRTFGELCGDLCVHCTEDEAPARAAGFLREWVESGLIVEVTR